MRLPTCYLDWRCYKKAPRSLCLLTWCGPTLEETENLQICLSLGMY
jgi:hypothetical protein